MKTILHKLDLLGFDSYIDALVAFYNSPLNCWDLSELSNEEYNTLLINHKTINS